MTSTTAVNVLIGVVMPLVIALINQCHWTSKLKALVALVTCVGAAAITEAIRSGDAFSLAHWRATAIVIAGAALISYQTWWRPSTWAPSLEAATTLSTGGPSAAP